MEEGLQPLPRRLGDAFPVHRRHLRAPRDLQPRDGQLPPVAGDRIRMGREQHQASLLHPLRRPLVRRDALLRARRRVHVRSDPPHAGPGPPEAVELPRGRCRHRRRHRRVHLQAALHSGPRLHRPAPHRCRAHMEGRGAAGGLRRPGPGGDGAVHRGAAIRGHRVRPGPQPQVLAERQAGRRRAARALASQQRRDRQGAVRRRGRLGVPLPARHREELGGQGSGAPSVLVSGLRTDGAPLPEHAPEAVQRAGRAEGRQHGDRPAAHHERSDERVPDPRRRDRPRRVAEALEGCGAPGRHRLDQEGRGAGEPPAGRGRSRARQRRYPCGSRIGAHALRDQRRAGLDGLGRRRGHRPAEPRRDRHRRVREGARLRPLARSAQAGPPST